MEEAIISCFRRGLKPQIETRLPLNLAVEEVMKKAVEIEKQYNTRASLLASVTRHENRHKSVLACDTCQMEGHISKDCPRNQKFCKYCKTPGHTEEYCYQKKKQNKETCQTCGRSGHNSKTCYTNATCQLCGRTGHTAIRCRNGKSQSTGVVCQLCQESGHIVARYEEKPIS